MYFNILPLSMPWCEGFSYPPSTLGCLYKGIEGIATHADTDQTWLRFRFQTYKQPLIPKQRWLTVMRWDDDVPKEQHLQKKLLGADCQEQYLQKLFLLGEGWSVTHFSDSPPKFWNVFLNHTKKHVEKYYLHTFYILWVDPGNMACFMLTDGIESPSNAWW